MKSLIRFLVIFAALNLIAACAPYKKKYLNSTAPGSYEQNPETPSNNPVTNNPTQQSTPGKDPVVQEPVTPKSFVKASGNKLVDANGKDLFLKGINLGNWLVWEGYLMMGDWKFRTHSQFFASLASAFGSQEKAIEFEKQWRLNYVDDKVIGELSGLGYNSVRVPFNYILFWSNGKVSDQGFEYIDNLISYCRSRGMYVILDMHGAPGYQNPGDHSDNGNSNDKQPRDSVKFWDGDNVATAAKIWRHIAERYKDETVVLGYDLLNEPVLQDGREYELLPSYVKIRNGIREVDNNHVIIAEGSFWGSDLSKIDWEDATVQSKTGIKAKWDDNLMYEIHHYGPVADTMGRENTSNRLKVPLILGEFGENDEAIIDATNRWAKQKLAGAFAWSFKKMSHDKTLWTIPPNASYDKIRNFINNGGYAPTDEYDAMISFAKTNIKNGHPSIVWHQSFYDAVSPK